MLQSRGTKNMGRALVTDSDGNANGRPRGYARRLGPSLVILVLLSALVGANLLYAQLEGPIKPILGAPGELLYVSTFDGFLDEWDLYKGQQSATIEDGHLRLALSSAQKQSWSVARHHFADVDFSVVAKAVAGPVDNAFGVVFAMQSRSDRSCDLPAVVFCGISQWSALLGAGLRQVLDPVSSTHYYAFLISSDGYYALERIVDGAREVISTWIPSPNVRQGLGVDNRIRVVARRSQLEFFVNGMRMLLCIPDEPDTSSTFANNECIGGKMVERFQAPDPAQGKLGLIAQATQTGGGGVVVDFDNVTVFSPHIAVGEDARL